MKTRIIKIEEQEVRITFLPKWRHWHLLIPFKDLRIEQWPIIIQKDLHQLICEARYQIRTHKMKRSIIDLEKV